MRFKSSDLHGANFSEKWLLFCVDSCRYVTATFGQLKAAHPVAHAV